MRLLAVMAGVVVGLSGCFGAPLVHRAPSGNETADPARDGAGDDAPPWTLNGTSDRIAGGGDKTPTGDDKKPGDDKKGGDDGGGGNNTDNSTDPPPPDPGDDDELPIPGYGMEDPHEDWVDEVGETVDETPPPSKDPVGDAAGEADGAANRAEKDTGEIPSTESILFGS